MRRKPVSPSPANRFVGTEWIPEDRSEEEAILAHTPADVVVAALRPVLGEARSSRLDQVAQSRLASVTVVLENLYDPHNGGAALRSCEAAGLHAVHVVEGSQRFRVTSKVTQGADKWLDIHRYKDIGQAVSVLRKDGFALYAAMPSAKVTLTELDPGKKAAFLIGNEHAGLSKEAQAACDVAFRIPLHGFSESVNLSVATALTIFRHTERVRQSLAGATDLAEEALLSLRARYYIRGIRGAAEIVKWAKDKGSKPPVRPGL